MKLFKSLFMSVIPIIFLSIFSEGVLAATAQTTSAATVQFAPPSGVLLTLDSVPALNFGTQTSSVSDKDYASLANAPLVEVTDQRDLSNATGWKVTVQATAFESTAGGTLNGAQINFNSSGTPVQESGIGSGAPTTPASFAITTDGSMGAVRIITAAAGDGRGTWETSWPKENIALHVPGGTMDSGLVYTSTLTWTLEDTP